MLSFKFSSLVLFTERTISNCLIVFSNEIVHFTCFDKPLISYSLTDIHLRNFQVRLIHLFLNLFGSFFQVAVVPIFAVIKRRAPLWFHALSLTIIYIPFNQLTLKFKVEFANISTSFLNFLKEILLSGRDLKILIVIFKQPHKTQILISNFDGPRCLTIFIFFASSLANWPYWLVFLAALYYI